MPEKTETNAGVGAAPIDQEALRVEIEKRAYFRYCERGCVPGGEVEDWLAAEQEVLAEHARTGATESSGAGNEPLGGPPAARRTRRR